MTGDIREKTFWVFYGKGGWNGKTSMIEAIDATMGDYAFSLPVGAILANRDDKIAQEMADLLGKRFVHTSELPKGKRYNETLLKDITGGEEIYGEKKYKDGFLFHPAFKLFMSGNAAPAFGGDEALWGRAKTVPFNFDFRTLPVPDKTAKDRLRTPEHRPAILAWMMKGCLVWQATGLRTPESVEKTTTKHRHEVDIIRAFVAERCTEATTLAAAVSRQEMYRTFKPWAREQPSSQPLLQAEFEEGMQKAGYELVQAYGAGGQKGYRWKGLRLRRDHDDA